MNVLCISDPNAKTSCNLVKVRTGSYQDPPELTGLANLLERMVFLGSKIYTDPQEFDDFFAENGGTNNSYTSNTDTFYSLETSNDDLYEAMDRLADGLCHPLLLPGIIGKEIEAVENNFEMMFKDQKWRSKHLIELLSNENSFCNKSKKTNFEKWDINNLRKNLMLFHNKYYYASQMFAIVSGRDSLADIIKNSVEIYQNIPNKNMACKEHKNMQ